MARGLVNIDVDGLRGVHVRTLRGDLRVARGWWVHEGSERRTSFNYVFYEDGSRLSKIQKHGHAPVIVTRSRD